MFNDELNAVKKEFNTKKVQLPPLHPKYAGLASWAKSLKKRIDKPMEVDFLICFTRTSVLISTDAYCNV